MPRILGVDIPKNKRIEYALPYVYGIGEYMARAICKACSIELGTRADKLSDDDVARIAAYIEKAVVCEGQLRRQVATNIQRLKDIRSVRGLRHRAGLPVRGQRTRSNARTRKGPKKTVAGKKRVGMK
jgi:small subunit ribosomal protein S13